MQLDEGTMAMMLDKFECVQSHIQESAKQSRQFQYVHTVYVLD